MVPEYQICPTLAYMKLCVHAEHIFILPLVEHKVLFVWEVYLPFLSLIKVSVFDTISPFCDGIIIKNMIWYNINVHCKDLYFFFLSFYKGKNSKETGRHISRARCTLLVNGHLRVISCASCILIYEIAIFGKIAQSFFQSRPPLISHFRQLHPSAEKNMKNMKNGSSEKQRDNYVVLEIICVKMTVYR